MTFKRPPVIATILLLVAVSVLCVLGAWQIQRLNWKRGLLTSINEAYANPAQEIESGNDLLQAQAQQGSPFFLRTSLHGRFLIDQSVYIIPRIHDGMQGYHLITPMVLDDGAIILVNRGWVPAGMKDSDLDPAAGSHSLTGLIRYPDRENAFTPANDPSENLWYTINIDEITKYLKLDQEALPFIFYPEDQTGTYPIALGQKPVLNNNHLSYALFWFGMAAVLIGVFVLRFMVVYRDNPPAAGEISP